MAMSRFQTGLSLSRHYIRPTSVDDDDDDVRGREASYRGWTSRVPKHRLIGAGFSYTGERDIVRCMTCGLVLSNVKERDDPLRRHITERPDCRLIQQLMNRRNRMNRIGVIGHSVQEEHGQDMFVSSLHPVEFIKTTESFQSPLMQKIQELSLDYFELGHQIGKGCYAAVHEARIKPDTKVSTEEATEDQSDVQQIQEVSEDMEVSEDQLGERLQEFIKTTESFQSPLMQKIQELSLDYFELGHQIGKGCYAAVHEARIKPDTKVSTEEATEDQSDVQQIQEVSEDMEVSEDQLGERLQRPSARQVADILHVLLLVPEQWTLPGTHVDRSEVRWWVITMATEVLLETRLKLSGTVDTAVKRQFIEGFNMNRFLEMLGSLQNV